MGMPLAARPAPPRLSSMVWGAWSVEGAAQRVAVGARLHGWVALDACAEACVVLVAEEQVRQAHFGSDAGVAGGEEFEFACGGDVCHMQPGIVFAGKAYGEFRTAVAAFGRAYARMFADGDFASGIFLAGFGHGLVHHVGVFAVYHDGEFGIPEDGVQGFGAFHLEVSGAVAHEELDADGVALVELVEFFGIV